MSCFPGGHAASPGMTHSLHPHHTSSSLLLHSPIIPHSSCIFPSSASLTSPSSPVSNPLLSPRAATLSLSSPTPHPLSYSCFSALTIILSVHPGWPVNSHFHFSPSCFSCSLLSVILLLAFRAVPRYLQLSGWKLALENSQDLVKRPISPPTKHTHPHKHINTHVHKHATNQIQ